MVTSFQLLDAVFLSLGVAAGLMLLVAAVSRGAGWRGVVRRLSRLAPASRDGWVLTAAVAAAIYAGVAGFDLGSGLYGCSGTPGSHDAVAFLASGRAFLSGGNPFVVSDCGQTIPVPYGLANICLNAIGSVGGLAGVAAVWGAVTVALVPLAWFAAGADRRIATAIVATSPLYLPLAVGQIDGASNLLVPVAVLFALLVARRASPLGTAVGGFLATGRFPTEVPLVGAGARLRSPGWSVGIALATFAALSGLTYLRYGSDYVTTVFLDQVGRRGFSLNAYGILIREGWLPASSLVTMLEVGLTAALVGFVWWRSRTPLGAATTSLAGFALLTPFLSFNVLGWLLPVALVGARPRAWLWALGVVGTADYFLAFQWAARTLGIWWPYEVLDAVLTAILVALFVDLVRADGSPRSPIGAPTPSA